MRIDGTSDDRGAWGPVAVAPTRPRDRDLPVQSGAAADKVVAARQPWPNRVFRSVLRPCGLYGAGATVARISFCAWSGLAHMRVTSVPGWAHARSIMHNKILKKAPLSSLGSRRSGRAPYCGSTHGHRVDSRTQSPAPGSPGAGSE